MDAIEGLIKGMESDALVKNDKIFNAIIKISFHHSSRRERILSILKFLNSFFL